MNEWSCTDINRNATPGDMYEIWHLAFSRSILNIYLGHLCVVRWRENCCGMDGGKKRKRKIQFCINNLSPQMALFYFHIKKRDIDRDIFHVYDNRWPYEWMIACLYATFGEHWRISKHRTFLFIFVYLFALIPAFFFNRFLFMLFLGILWELTQSKWNFLSDEMI